MRTFTPSRVAIGYVALFVVLAAVLAVAIPTGVAQQHAGVGGVYEIQDESGCLEEPAALRLEQTGRSVVARYDGLDVPDDPAGVLTLDVDRLSGDLRCSDGGTAELMATAEGEREHRTLTGTLGGAAFSATESEGELRAASKPRNAEDTFARLMLAIAAVMLAARLLGWAASRLGQPRVMGEVLAGILLGPTLLGRVAGDVTGYLFPADITALLQAGASIGLAFYMFLVGLELDAKMLRGRVSQAAFISNASVIVPMALGIGIALPIYTLLAPAAFLPFAIFMGVAMSITAFPVLARILVERRMLGHAVGALAIASAAIDDVTAWGLLAIASALAGEGGALDMVRIVGLTILFTAGMALVVRRLIARVSVAYDEAGHVPLEWVAGVFLSVLLAAFVAGWIGIAPIFGAFVMGMIMPRRADLTHDISRRMEDFVIIVLLPLFFVVSGLRVNLDLLDSPGLWLLTLLLIGVAIAGKWLTAMLAARYSGLRLRDSAVLGALMNTRGLTELIVLNIGLDLGVISPTLFTMLVIMALVTTFMTGPALRILDPRNQLSTRAEDELKAAEPSPLAARIRIPDGAVLVAPQDAKNLDPLLTLAESIAAHPARQLLLVRLLDTTRLATGLAADDRRLRTARREMLERRERLTARGIAVRAVAFSSADPGDDLVRMASEDGIDLLLLDGSRPLLGDGIPTGAVGRALSDAPCDVGVLIERHNSVLELGRERPVVVPFGGAEHDWAALELGAWIATSRGAPLRLLGMAGVQEAGRDASRLLASASLVVQQLTGLSAEPVLVDGRDGIIAAAAGAGLLVVGLSERWRQEGLGPVRATIARSAPSSTLFVRRGHRAGALAPRESATRFAWSVVGAAPATGGNAPEAPESGRSQE